MYNSINNYNYLFFESIENISHIFRIPEYITVDNWMKNENLLSYFNSISFDYKKFIDSINITKYLTVAYIENYLIVKKIKYTVIHYLENYDNEFRCFYKTSYSCNNKDNLYSNSV